VKKEVIEFELVVERICGIDLHKDTVVATIHGKCLKTQTRSFKTFTNLLIKLRNWLQKHKISHIAMESTGVYWKPVFNVLGDETSMMFLSIIS
jgi:transposase